MSSKKWSKIDAVVHFIVLNISNRECTDVIIAKHGAPTYLISHTIP